MATSRQVDLTFDLAYPTEHYKFLQRLGERRSTDIVVQIYNKGIPYNISGTILGFEMRNDRNKVVIDKEQSRFTKVTPLQGVFSYKPPEEVQSFYGNAYLAYFTLENGADRVTTERFRFYNDEDVQACIAPDLQEHYVSVIDDLVASNASAMDKANEIKDLIEANQVVKKAGDTMSGNLSMINPDGAISQRFTAGATGTTVGWESLTDGTFRLYDWKNSRNVLSYNPVTDYVSLNRKHPYVTKTGDTMTGDLNVVDNKGISFMDTTDPTKRKAYMSSGGNVTSLYDSLSSGRVWWYDHSTQTFTVDKNTNLAKKTGDTFTGSMTFDNPITLRGAAANLDMRPQVSGAYQKGFRHTVNTTNNFYAVAPIDDTGSATWANQFSLNGTTGVFDVKDINVRVGSASNVVTTLKDGRATLILTADASNIDAVNIAPIADRRGNTVSIRMAIKRIVSTGSAVLTTLPVNMRPLSAQHNILTAMDGTKGRLQIRDNGELAILDVAGSAQNKDFYFTATYVVD